MGAFSYLSLTADDESEREQRTRFKAFSNHIMIYEAALSAYIAVGRVFSAREINRDPNRALYLGTLREWMQASGGSANSLNNYMDMQKNYIETRVSLPDITISLPYKASDKLEAAERIIRSYFPSFNMPRTFVKNDPPIGRTFKISENVNDLMSVERVTRVKTDFTPAFEVAKDAESSFKLPKNYHDNGFNGIAYLDMTLNFDKARLEDPNYNQFGIPDTGSLLDGYTANVTLTMEAVFRWPMDFARWVTCTGEKDEFVPFMFFQYINSHRAAYLAKRTRGGGYTTHTPARVNHLGKIVEMMQAEQKQGRKAQVRTNADGFLILGTGEPAQLGAVLWVPKVNNVPEYMNQIKSCYDAQAKTMDLAKFRMGGVPILTDPNNEKFTYVREAGAKGGSSDISGLITFDLTGSVALDDTTIYRYLNTRLGEERNSEQVKEFLVELNQYATGMIQGGGNVDAIFNDKTLKDMGFDDFDARKGKRLFMDAIDHFLQNPDLDIRWMHFYSGNKFKINLTGSSFEEGSTELASANAGIQFKVKRTRALLELVFRTSMSMLRDFDSLKIGFAAKVEKWRFLLYLTCNYSTNARDLALDYQDKVLLNSARDYMASEVLKPQGLTIANMPGLQKMLPHQVECALDINMEPEMMLLEADVGGGKGMMGPLQAVMYLQKGLIKRPLFLVPGRLVSNWTNEIAKYSKGQINPFPLTLPIMRRLQRTYKGEKGTTTRPDYSFLKKIIDACPPNTFFVTSFNFLVSDAETITYANAEAQRFYAAEFFRDMKIFDLVILDESHVVKNLSARATVAASIVTSPAKYKTEMSGTIVSNTLMDLVGQSAIGNPSALGNSKRFATNYASVYTGRGGDISVSEWRPDAAAMIVNDMKPYVKRVIKKKDRWAFILPNTNELFHTTHLTKNQQSFYDFQLDKQVEELKKKNPSLYEKMMDGNEKDEAAIAMGLDMHFQSLEAFIGAPDLNEEFAAIPGLSEDDLTSAKLKETVKILDGHFEGYTDDEGTQIAPSKYKVIIFAARIPTVQHFERRMPEKYKGRMAVYYAGDEQALEAFKNVPGIDILLAAEQSANTGQNFQMGSRMIRTEALWAPGGQIQAAGRIDRPDFNDSGRDQIYLDWIMVNKTLDVTKIARIISKNVEKMKYDRQEDPYFVARPFTPSPFIMGNANFTSALPEVRKPGLTIEKMFTSLPLIKMNFKTFKKINQVNQLDAYFASYALMLDFTKQQYDREKETGLHQLVEITPDMRATIPGSKKIDFMPRLPNVDPAYFDLNNEWGYKPISRLQLEINIQKMQRSDVEDDTDEEGDDYVDINPVNEGDLVDTEFGIGKVTKILKNEVWVDIPGFKKVRVLKACTWLITNPDKLKAVVRDLNRGKTFVRTLPGIGMADMEFDDPQIDVETETPESTEPEPMLEPDVAPEPERPTDDIVAPEKDAIDEFDEEEAGTEDPGEDGDISVFPFVVDGQVALVTEIEDEPISLKVIGNFGFTHFASYYAIWIKTPKALDDTLNLLNKKFTIDPKVLANFEPYKDLLRTPDRLDTIDPARFRNVVQFFKRDIHRKLQKGQLRPYPLVFGKKFFIIIDQLSTPSYLNALRAIQTAAIPGVKMAKKRQDDIHVKFYPSIAAAGEALKDLNEKIKILNMPAALRLLKSMTARPQVKNLGTRTAAPAPTPEVKPAATTPKGWSRPVVKSIRNRT